MVFIFGGAYQGMEDYARENFGVKEIFTACEDTREIDFSCGCAAGLDRFVLGCIRRGESAQEYFRAHADAWKDAVLIGTDFSCGVVPMDAELRLWRDENGRLNNMLSGAAETVVRMFCGIGQVVK